MMEDTEVIPAKRRRRTRLAPDVEILLNELLEDIRDPPSDSLYFTSQDDGEEISGKIISIKLKNFMCHDNLEFDFDEHINFISGKNGSGKSALLTALVVGLGGRAADTNRGQAVKNLIQHGKTQATIEITLKNTGPMKFKPHVYGKTITIVRVITPTASKYKIIAQNGEVISQKRQHIDVINMFLNIQVCNPVVILNQDTARTFIKSALPKDLYSVYMKGTGLEEMQSRILSLEDEKIPQIEKVIEEKRLILEASNSDLRKFEETLKKMEELKKQKLKTSELQQQLSWARVMAIEADLTAQNTLKLKAEQNLPLIKNKIDNRGKVETELKDKIKTASEALKSKQKKAQELDSEAVEQELAAQHTKELIKMKIEEIRRVKKKIDAERKCCGDLEAEISNHHSRSTELEARKTQHQTEMSELEKRLTELRAVAQTTLVHQQQLADTHRQAATVTAEKEQFLRNTKQKLAYKEEKIRSLKTEKNELIVYSQWMPHIIEQIEIAFNENKFKKKPVGPLGFYIRVKDPSWGPAIEDFLGIRSLSTICVDNFDDHKVLISILNRLNVPRVQRPPINISRFFDKVHDVSPYESGSGNLRNLFRSVIISHPVAANFFIDSRDPQSILLIPNSEQAYGLMESVENVPRKCKSAFTLKGDIFYPAPHYRSYAGNIKENSTTKVLQVSRENALKAAEQEVLSARHDLKKIEYDFEQSRAALSEAKRKLEDVNREVTKVKQQIAVCENKLDTLKNEEFPESYDVNYFRDALEFRQKNIESAESTVKALESDKNALVVKYKEANDKFENSKSTRDSLLQDINKLENEIDDFEKECRELNSKSHHLLNLYKNEETKLKQINDGITNLKKQLEESEKLARKSHPERLNPTKDLAALESEVKKMQIKVTALEKHIQDSNPVPEDYQARIQQFHQKEELLRTLVHVSQKAKECVTDLRKAYRKEKKEIFARTKESFLNFLEKKKLSGDLVLDDEKKTLKVVIKVQEEANAKSSTLTLSGGERSYSMVSFILALWNNMAAPFFFLDEFDVFMDEINRNMVMTFLLEHAKSKPEQQFVFLTPHGNLNTEILRDVKLSRMPDPRS